MVLIGRKLTEVPAGDQSEGNIISALIMAWPRSMDSGVPLYKLQIRESNETRYSSHIYIKDFVYAFRAL